MKTDFDQLMAYRKTIKGKPDIYQRMQLDLNQIAIDFYKTALYHDAGRSNCVCRMCELKKQGKYDNEFALLNKHAKKIV